MSIFRFIKIIQAAIISLLQHKLRSALSILGIICGVMAVLSMLSVGEGARRETIRQIEQLGTRNIYFKAVTYTRDQTERARERLSRGLTVEDMDRIRKAGDMVTDVAGFKEVSAATLGFNREITPQLMACTANVARLQNIPVAEGRFISDADLIHRNFVCVVGDGIAGKSGRRLKAGEFIRVGPQMLKVVGILGRLSMEQPESTAIVVRNHNAMIYIPLGTERWIEPLQKAPDTSVQGLSEIVVQIRETGQVLDAAPVIQRIMNVSHKGVTDYQMVVPQELLRQSRRTQRIFNIVLGAIAGISLLVGGIGIMNVMLASVSERKGEIGIRRAVGASRLHITAQFLVESVLLTFSGGFFGVLIGKGCVWMIATLAGWETAITPYAVGVPLLMSVLIGVFFGLYPARRAAMLDPITALRHE